jgi:hypothetical protein
MCRRLVILATLALTGPVFADGWKKPADDAVHEAEVKDFLAYAAAVKKVGGSEGALYYAREDALEAASGDKDEIQFANYSIVTIARQLVIEATPAETWEKAVKTAEEKLAGARKKLDEVERNAPKELLEVDKAYEEAFHAKQAADASARECRAKQDEFVAADEKFMKSDRAERPKLLEQVDTARREKNEAEDKKIEQRRKFDSARRKAQDMRDELLVAKKTTGLQELEQVVDAHRELDELSAAKNAKTDGTKLDSSLEPSVAPVKAKLPEIQKALADLGAPVFRAAAK